MDTRRDLAFLAAGSVLGGLVSVLINKVMGSAPSLLVTVASLIILIFLALIAIRALGPLNLIFANSAGFHLSGEWTGSFRYVKNGEEVVVNESLTIRQRGRFMRGESRSTTILGDFPLSGTAYMFSASIRPDGVLDGSWHNSVSRQRFHGAFQAKVRRRGTTIIGTWIGVDDSGIQRGEFEWTRNSG